MTLRVLCPALVILAILGVAPAADRAAAIARLIDQLGSKNFEEREQASRSLEKLREAALPALRKAAAEHADPEVRERSRKAADLIADGILRDKRFARRVLNLGMDIHEAYVVERDLGDLVAETVRGLYAQEQADIPAPIARQLGKARGADADTLAALLRDVRADLATHATFKGDTDALQAARVMLAGLDPFSRLMEEPVRFDHVPPDPQDNALGARIEIDPETRALRIVTPYVGGPAYDAGLRGGDRITHVMEPGAGARLAPPRVIPMAGLSLTRMASKLWGPRGAKVHLLVVRQGEVASKQATVVRGPFEREYVCGVRRIENDAWDYLLDREDKIAYLRVPQFASGTADQVAGVVARLRQDGMKGLILDLRFNPGGLLSESVKLADLFIDDGMIVRVAGRNGREETRRGQREGSLLDFPIVCLVNGETASAAEIVSACLQDHQRATIVGERTRGKGSVQSITNQSELDVQLKLTTALFYRPNGKKIDRLRVPGTPEDEWGVSPAKNSLVALTGGEREKVRAHLGQAEIIARRRAKEEGASFKDRQLAHALERLQRRLEKP